jgi:hypothetical protein
MQVKYDNSWKTTIAIRKMHKRHNVYSTLWWPPSVKGCAQPLSSDPKIKLEYHVVLPYIKSLYEESPQVGVSHALHEWSQSKHKSKEGVETHTRVQEQQHHAHKQKREHRNQNDRVFSQENTQFSLERVESVVALNRSFGVLLVCLGNNSMFLGGYLIAPRAKGVVSSLFGRPWLPSVRRCTKLSGAHRTLNCAQFLSIPAPPIVQLAVASFGCPAHRIVRSCHVSTVDSAPTVGASESRWRHGSLDSPVHTG